MPTLADWIDATLAGHAVPTPVTDLPDARRARVWWLALMQAADRHPGLNHAAWTALWRRLPPFLGPDNRIDGKPVLNHLMGIPHERGTFLLGRAFQAWDAERVAQAIPSGPSTQPLGPPAAATADAPNVPCRAPGTAVPGLDRAGATPGGPCGRAPRALVPVAAPDDDRARRVASSPDRAGLVGHPSTVWPSGV